MSRRPASHAGSWYTDRKDQLAAQLQSWLQEVDECCGAARAIIAPHAGYSYSGPTAAWAYKSIQPSQVQRIFVLGPSHNVYTPRCAVTRCSTYETPLGDIPIDRQICADLLATGLYDEMEQSVDEQEHSIEMHLPYIVHVMGGQPFTLVPILVGALSEEAEARYGQLLAPYLMQQGNLLIISSDFCHWGRRFRFQHYDRTRGQIFESIEALDQRGMALIEAQDPGGFAAYQKQFGNTICGQFPIAVLLHALEHCRRIRKHALRFVRYAQSSRCRSMSDSSVSYASAIVWCPETEEAYQNARE